MVPSKPKLIFKADVQRRPYFRRFMWSVLATVAAAGAYVALDRALARQVVDQVALVDFGRRLALGVAMIFGVRMLLNAVRAIARKDESLRFYDKGFTWKRGRNQAKYSWMQVDTFREGVRSLRIAGRPIAQFGAHVLKMSDGRTFRFTNRYGDTRQFVQAVRPYIAQATGIRMGRTLRDGKPVRIHRQLRVLPKGIEAGKHKIPWSQADVDVRRGALVVGWRAKNGELRTARRYDVHSVNNLGGFIELAHSTIRNYQRDRFAVQDATLQEELPQW